MPHPMPAIDRDRSQNDDVPVVAKLKDTVSFQRGLGNSGKRYRIVEHDCPTCSMDRMFQKLHVVPTGSDRAQYYCLNPNCPHYHEGRFDFTGMATPKPNTPAITE